jgi:hypothetical protein
MEIGQWLESIGEEQWADVFRFNDTNDIDELVR